MHAAGADDRKRIGPEGPVHCGVGAHCGLEPQPAQSRSCMYIGPALLAHFFQPLVLWQSSGTALILAVKRCVGQKKKKQPPRCAFSFAALASVS